MPLFTDSAPSQPSLRSLAPGSVIIPPLGWYWLNTGRFGLAELQRYDPTSECWRYAGDNGNCNNLFYSDGKTTRVANPTGCVVAALVTTAGSGYTSAPTITVGEGGSTWQAIVGGAVSTAATIANAGNNYIYPPQLLISGPGNPGIRAAGYTTLTNGTISAVTITEQGAGYTAPPPVAVIPDPRDLTGSGGIITLALTGAGTITGLLCTDMGTPILSGTVPTLTFSSGGAAATAIMDWVVQSCSITTAGAGYTSAAGAVIVSGAGGVVTTAGAYTGSDTANRLQRWRRAAVDVVTNSSGGLSSVGQIIDPGRYQSVPTVSVDMSAQTPSTVAVLNFVMGGVDATVFLHPAQS